MTLYEYRSWGGNRRTVEADEVTFEPGHVAFWRSQPDTIAGRELVLAEDNPNVNHLQPAPDPD